MLSVVAVEEKDAISIKSVKLAMELRGHKANKPLIKSDGQLTFLFDHNKLTTSSSHQTCKPR